MIEESVCTKIAVGPFHSPWKKLTTVWHLYLIECADGSLYTGVTTDVERRFAEHVAGTGARYTRSRLPVVLVASRPVGSKPQALRAEFAIKRLPRGKKIDAVRSLTIED